MYLYFSDWSDFIGTLDEKGFSHGGKIIKVYACQNDPREILRKPYLFVLKGNNGPFKEDEVFHYSERESYSGPELENQLTGLGLNETAKKYFRAVFRFDNSPEAQSNQCMMSMKNPDGSWAYNHPFDSIDGISLTKQYPSTRSVALHTDIFDPKSIARLRQFIDLDNKELLGTRFDVLEVIKQENALQKIEGNPISAERR